MMLWFRHGRRLSPGWAVACMVIAAALMAGCGKKGDPVPPRHQPPPVVKDLKAKVDGERVILTWTVPPAAAKQGLADKVVIYRFRSVAGDAVCPGCPPVYVPVATVAVGSGGPMAYAVQMEEGYRYRFKVAIKGKDGVPGEESDPVRIEY